MEFGSSNLEEGELSNDSDSYTPLQRPSNYSTSDDKRFSKNIKHEYENDQMSSTETDSNTDLAFKRARKMKPTKVLPMKQSTSTSNIKRKKYDIWSTRAQEQVLSETLNTCEVTEKDNRSRDVETYDYSLNRRYYKHENVEWANNKRTRIDRRTTTLRLTPRPDEKKDIKMVPRYILDLNKTTKCTDEELAIDAANKLCEEKEDLILKIVKIIGQENTRRIFNDVKKIEATGGMMIMNQTRRRTPGGIFLFLVKHDTELSPEQRQVIFENDRLNYREFRKLRKRAPIDTTKTKIVPPPPSRNLKLPNSQTRANLVQKVKKEAWSPSASTTHKEVGNPPPKPSTASHSSGEGSKSKEGNPPPVISIKVEPHEDDFLEINASDDMELL